MAGHGCWWVWERIWDVDRLYWRDCSPWRRELSLEEDWLAVEPWPVDETILGEKDGEQWNHINQDIG
jgi:hypothetical protein